jgi:hypothetical protein
MALVQTLYCSACAMPDQRIGSWAGGRGLAGCRGLSLAEMTRVYPSRGRLRCSVSGSVGPKLALGLTPYPLQIPHKRMQPSLNVLFQPYDKFTPLFYLINLK